MHLRGSCLRRVDGRRRPDPQAGPRGPLSRRIVTQDNAGPAVAPNNGVAAAHRRIIVFLDEDDVPAPVCLGAHARSHAHSEEVVVVVPMLSPPGADMSQDLRG